MKIIKFVLISLFSLIFFPVNTFGQSGGSYSITQSVISGGGGQNAGGGFFSVDGTVGQKAVGINPAGGNFNIQSGFWIQQFAPTAANVSVGGRIMTAERYGVSNVAISLTNVVTGEVQFTRSASFGYYLFESVRTGETYILRVNSKRFVFDSESRILTPFDKINDADFTAIPK